MPISVTHPEDGQEMHLNVWDFAGQQIEHATHQFFLTEGALYLILWSARQGPDAGKRDVYYWLELLRMRVPDAKFLLVATHAVKTPPDLPWPDIRKLAGDAFAGHLDVDLCTGRGFPELRKKIVELAADSPSMNSLWNMRWLAVRDAIRSTKEQQQYLRPDAFQKLMADNGVTGEEEQRALAGQLHELGEILYHVDRADLAEFVLLDCEWVTEVVGHVSRSKEVREEEGILKRAALNKIWKQAKVPAELRTHLLRLMDNFDLSYATGHAGQPAAMEDVAVVVEALPYYAGEKLEDWENAAGQPELNLVLEFPNLYRRLPPGIPTWGIARAHRFSACHPWRNLALFRYEDRNGKVSLGMLRADELSREVHVSVRSEYPPYLHGILSGIVDDTIRRYPGLKVVESVPCRCRPDCTESFPLDLLIAKQKRGGATVDCGQSYKERSVVELLTGLVPNVPFQPRPGSEQTVLAEMRREFTSLRRSQNELVSKTCPSVFQLFLNATGRPSTAPWNT